MNKSIILPILAILLAISLVVGFDLAWYHYITGTLKTYGVSDSDIIERLDHFYFIIGFEVFMSFFGIMICMVTIGIDDSSSSAWPF